MTSGRVVRDFRKQAGKVAQDTVKTLTPAFIDHETRLRNLELWAERFSNLSLWGRLKWLALGR